ncbi:hypothetical protein TNCV_4384321 [Trichonephila clavipes]|nr:hypothetical protein TNCV_4384321 [Trichonephila clavipes]
MMYCLWKIKFYRERAPPSMKLNSMVTLEDVSRVTILTLQKLPEAVTKLAAVQEEIKASQDERIQDEIKAIQGEVKAIDHDSVTLTSRLPRPKTKEELKEKIEKHAGTLNTRRAASPLAVVGGREREVGGPWPPPGFSPSNLGWNRENSYCHLHGAHS